MRAKTTQSVAKAPRRAAGSFVTRSGERFYEISGVDGMPPFFISVVSSDDHWLFVSSTGGLTAGRVSPETALFPYVPVDKVHECPAHTGPRTIVRVQHSEESRYWEPFNYEHRGRYNLSRSVYKNTLGNKLAFEETNHDLGLIFRYTWSTSAEFGFVRDCDLVNEGSNDVFVEFIDGLQNILPAGTPRYAQSNYSNLVDAYKWTELDEQSGLAFITLYSGITDRPEPSESLKATTAFCLGLDNPTVLLSSEQLDAFRDGLDPIQENHKRGIRGAYLVTHGQNLVSKQRISWRLVLDVEKSQSEASKLRQLLLTDDSLGERVTQSIASGSEELARIMASADAFQSTAEETVTVHHYANVLFNVLRGGIVADQYNVSGDDFRKTVRNFNKTVFDRNRELLSALPDKVRYEELLDSVRRAEDDQLTRLALEYLPITFGRRHGDPSRPWNEFAIHLKDENANALLSYQGNWRDIFQNWEALAFSYPDFVESMIAKFVNASTIDGYNPYRITKEGIDWEIEEPDNPWSYIGYWGDHQIIYLLKLLELSRDFHAEKLHTLLRSRVFCYANVPYRIKSFDELFSNPKNTVDYDEAEARMIDARVAALGADGKLFLDSSGDVYQVNLLEKLVVPLLAKLSNLVVDGGVWLNTQRPEWNDANNALVGQGLSMVTLCYVRRYVAFLLDLLKDEAGAFAITDEVHNWLSETSSALSELRDNLSADSVGDDFRYQSLRRLGTAASNFRERVYGRSALGNTSECSVDSIRELLNDAQAIVDQTIAANKRDDGLYHAYNIACFDDDTVSVGNLYPMLEGQVAALSAGTIDHNEAADIVDALYDSAIYRPDQNSFMLYPDRELPGFLERNQLPEKHVRAIPTLAVMLDEGDSRIVMQDPDNNLRFNAGISNAGDLRASLEKIDGEAVYDIEADCDAIVALYEAVFQHSEFTGRSGSMFGFEGLGSVYWHMVSKLMLAVADNFFDALDNDANAAVQQRLGDLYYRVRSGIGFNKSPAQYGAFPTDPYSHTPKHAGARQPGMTGQVKEEILSRFAELGIRVKNGRVSIRPALLRTQEFAEKSQPVRYLDVDGEWQTLILPESSLGFTWCQVPFVYCLSQGNAAAVEIELEDGSHINQTEYDLSAEHSADLFARNGRVRMVTVTLNPTMLFDRKS